MMHDKYLNANTSMCIQASACHQVSLNKCVIVQVLLACVMKAFVKEMSATKYPYVFCLNE